MAQCLADMAASYRTHASRSERQRRTARRLDEALAGRLVIEQAKGKIITERQLTLDQALGSLRLLGDHSRTHNAALRSVAEAVATLGLRFS